MKKIKWVERKNICDNIEYNIYLDSPNNYRIAAIVQKGNNIFRLDMPICSQAQKNIFSNLSEAKSEAIRRLKQMSEDLNKMFNEQTT